MPGPEAVDITVSSMSVLGVKSTSVSPQDQHSELTDGKQTHKIKSCAHPNVAVKVATSLM